MQIWDPHGTHPASKTANTNVKMSHNEGFECSPPGAFVIFLFVWVCSICGRVCEHIRKQAQSWHGSASSPASPLRVMTILCWNPRADRRAFKRSCAIVLLEMINQPRYGWEPRSCLRQRDGVRNPSVRHFLEAVLYKCMCGTDGGGGVMKTEEWEIEKLCGPRRTTRHVNHKAEIKHGEMRRGEAKDWRLLDKLGCSRCQWQNELKRKDFPHFTSLWFISLTGSSPICGVPRLSVHSRGITQPGSEQILGSWSGCYTKSAHLPSCCQATYFISAKEVFQEGGWGVTVLVLCKRLQLSPLSLQ